MGALEQMLPIERDDFFQRVKVNIIFGPVFDLFELILDHVEGTHRGQL